jgi:hypothetical protein
LKPDGWDEYVADIWPVLISVLNVVPGAGEQANPEILKFALESLCRAFLTWLRIIGIEYTAFEDGSVYCYWTKPAY